MCVLCGNTDMATSGNVFSYVKFAVPWTVPYEYFWCKFQSMATCTFFVCSKVLSHSSAVWLHYPMYFKSWHISYIRLNVKLASTGRSCSFSIKFKLLFPRTDLRVKFPCVAGEFAAALWRQKTNKSALCVRIAVCGWPIRLSGGKFICRNIRIYAPSIRVLSAGPEIYMLRNIYVFFVWIHPQKKYIMKYVIRSEPINENTKITVNWKAQDFSEEYGVNSYIQGTVLWLYHQIPSYGSLRENSAPDLRNLIISDTF